MLGKSLAATASHAAANGQGSAAATALSPVYLPPDLSDADENVEPGVLSDDATDEELRAYAATHPLAKKVMRIFRAKIVEITRIDPS